MSDSQLRIEAKCDGIARKLERIRRQMVISAWVVRGAIVLLWIVVPVIALVAAPR